MDIDSRRFTRHGRTTLRAGALNYGAASPLPAVAKSLAIRAGVFALVACCLFGDGRAAFAQGGMDRPHFLAINVGFGNRYKVGHFTPVDVVLAGGNTTTNGTIELTVPDGDGVESSFVAPGMSSALAGGEVSVRLYVKPGRVDSDFKAVFRDGDGRVIASHTFRPRIDEADSLHPRWAMAASDELIVGVGRSLGAASAVQKFRSNEIEGQDVQVAQLAGVASLPTRWEGYDGVDWLFLSTSDPEIYRSLTPNSAQTEALDEWLKMGGRLLVCVGRGAGEVLAPDGALARFVPGTFDRTVPLPSVSELEVYSGASGSIERQAVASQLRVPLLTGVRGRVEVAEGELPLVVRSSYGFGEVVFVAADLDRPPFVDWKGRVDLIARLLRWPDFSREKDANAAAAFAMDPGYSDLAGQLRGALDQFTGVQIAPFWFVALLVVGYIILIGPVDYFFVKKVLGRMEFTWVTFPVIVLVTSAGAYALAYWMKGTELLVNQVDVVDVDTETDLVRGTSWLNIFSPNMASYDVSLRPTPPGDASVADLDQTVSWLGLPGNGLGGMSTGNAPIWTRPYLFGPDLEALYGVPIQVWSTKSFTTRYSYHSATLGGAVESDLAEDAGQALVGRVTNGLDFPLTNCILAYDRWAYPIEKLEPGRSIELDRLSVRRELTTELSGRTAKVGDEGIEYSYTVEYDHYSQDVATIMRQMMFYDAAGGYAATDLMNRYQRFADLSIQLETHRAILFFRAPKPDDGGAQLMLDGKDKNGPNDRHWCWYRFLLPVERAETAP